MKKLLFLLTFTLLAFCLQAQDNDLLQRIKFAGNNVKSFETHLTNTTQSKSGKVKVDSGNLSFVSPNEFAALFETGRHMIVNQNQIKMDIGLFHGTFKLKDGGTMRSLSNIFLYGFKGLCQELADENDYSIDIKTGQYHTVTFTNNKKRLLGIGFRQVIFNFNKNDLLIKEIILIDTRGSRDTYTISDTKYNVTVSQDKFKI